MKKAKRERACTVFVRISIAVFGTPAHLSYALKSRDWGR